MILCDFGIFICTVRLIIAPLSYYKLLASSTVNKLENEQEATISGEKKIIGARAYALLVT